MRFVKIALLVLIFLFFPFCFAKAAPKKIKVYLDAPDIGYNESFSYYLMQRMQQVDEEDTSFEFLWVRKASVADYIITIIVDKNKLPVMIETAPSKHTMCYQYVVSLNLWKKDSPKTHEMMSQQVDCDPNAIAERLVAALQSSMGLGTVAKND